jgi:phosphate transport system substrate-binding protein
VKKPIRLTFLLVFTLVTSLLLAACGATATPTAAPTTAPATTAAATTAPATTAAATTAPATTAAATAAPTTARPTTAPATTAAATTAPAVAATPPGGYKVSSAATLTGSGASFPNPVYQEWIKLFATANPDVKLTYNSIGSGGGRNNFKNKEVDFAGTDAFPTDKEREDYGAASIAIPTTLGAVVVAYNLPGVTNLKMTPALVGDIFTGKVTKWNDPKIAAENSGVSLPDLAISIAVRQDNSGTTDVFSKWLATVSPDFKALGIAGGLPAWERGGVTVAKAPQNDGVTGLIKQTTGGLGYIEASYAIANNISYAAMKNPAGNYVKADLESISLAAAGAAVPNDFNINVFNSQDPKAYPTAATTWIWIPKEIADKAKGEALLKFLWWVVTDPAPIEAAKKLGYAPLPPAVVAKVQDSLKTVTSGGQPILK